MNLHLLPDAIAGKAVPALMLGSGLLLAAAEPITTAVPDGWTSLVTAIVQALTIGGGLAAAGAFMLRRGGQYFDNRARAEAEERAIDRGERERQYADHKETTTRYIASLEMRVQRTEERYDQLVNHLMGKPLASITHDTAPIGKE